MQPSLEKLRKFFGLEREKGYENTAIIGGLAKMLDYWEGEARAENIKEEIIQAVVQRLRSYEGLSPAVTRRRAEGPVEAHRRNLSRGRASGPATPSPRPAPGCIRPRAPVGSRRPDQAAPAPARNLRPRLPTGRAPSRRGSAPITPPRAESAPGGKHSQTPAALSAPLTVLQGVGPKHAATLETLGLHTLGRSALLLPAPLRRLQPAEAHQEPVVRRAGDRDRRGPVRAVPARSRAAAQDHH